MSTTNEILEKLETLQYRALRICLGTIEHLELNSFKEPRYLYLNIDEQFVSEILCISEVVIQHI